MGKNFMSVSHFVRYVAGCNGKDMYVKALTQELLYLLGETETGRQNPLSSSTIEMTSEIAMELYLSHAERKDRNCKVGETLPYYHR